MSPTRMTTAFLTFGAFSLCFVKIDLSRTRMTTLPFLLLALPPFVMSDSDYPLILCPLCKSDPLEYFYDTW